MIAYDGPVNILLVDDHPDNLLALEAVLGDLNCNLVKCLSGGEALRCLLKDEFAVILLDVQMPEMDGFETARLIKSRKKTQETPIIFISATSKEAEHFFTGYEAGAIDYMLKPFVPQILKAKIEGFVRLYVGSKTLQLQAELLQQQKIELERSNRELMETTYQLTKTQALTRAIQETSTDTMMTFDENGVILTVNPALKGMFGYAEEEVLGRPVTMLIPCFEDDRYRLEGSSGHSECGGASPVVQPRDAQGWGLPDDKAAAAEEWLAQPQRAAAVSGREAGSMEERDASVCPALSGERMQLNPLRKNGSRFPAELQIGIATIDEERIYACTVSDMTDRRRFERELMAAKETAEVASRAKTNFLTMVSHEIRTPMNGVLGMTGLMLDTELDAGQREYAEIIRKSGEALLSVINDILDYAKIESGKLEVEQLPFKLPLLIAETFDLFTAKSLQSRLALTYEPDPALPELLVGDEIKLRQVLVNLIGNAFKFTPEGSIVVASRLLATSGHAALIEFVVKDSGVGIPEDKLPLLFQPFSQVDTSLTRQYEGTGLGLAICKNLVEMMGGAIGVESVEGQGTTFRFTVQLNTWESAQDESAAESDAAEGQPSRFAEDELPRLLEGQPLDTQAQLPRLGEGQPLGDTQAQLPRLGEGQPLGDTQAQLPRLAEGQPLPQVEGSLATMMKNDSDKSYEDGFRELVEAYAAEHALSNGSAANPMLFTAERPAAAVLVADDNEINQKLTLSLLDKLGIAADVASNGSVAVELACHRNYDLILMDMRMPVMDGLEATRRVLASAPPGHAPVVVAMTANVLPSDRERCLEAGMADFLAKPIQFDAVKRVLKRYGIESVRSKSSM